MPANLDLKTSFNFPKRLTTTAYELYQLAEIPLFEKYKSPEGTMAPIRYQAICVWSAVKAGLILDWQSELVKEMNEATCQNADDVPLGLIEWVGEEVAAYVYQQKHLPKVFSWRWLIASIEKAALRWSSPKPGVSTGSAAQAR